VGGLFLQILVWIVLGLLGGFLFAKKGYSPRTGIIVGVLFGPLGLLISLFIPYTAEGRRMREEERRDRDELRLSRQNKTCPKCGCQHSVVNRFCPSCMYEYPMENRPEHVISLPGIRDDSATERA
jgi:hypothetical protein